MNRCMHAVLFSTQSRTCCLSTYFDWKFLRRYCRALTAFTCTEPIPLTSMLGGVEDPLKAFDRANARDCGCLAPLVGLLALRVDLGPSQDSVCVRLFSIFVVCTSIPNQVNPSSYRAAFLVCLISS